MSGKGSDRESLTLAIADLKAIDARLTNLVAADPPIESDGVNLTASIRESRDLVQAAIALLAGARIPDGTPNGVTDQLAGGTKRRVKIKAVSETTGSDGVARAEPPVRSSSGTTKASSKAAARGGDRSRDASAATSDAAAATVKAPANSLLARLGAAAPEPGALQRTATDGGAPSVAPADKSAPPATFDTADRLARLEAEIDSLTRASITADAQGKTVAPERAARPMATKTAEANNPSPAAAIDVPAPEHRSGIGDSGTADDEDAEIVIVNSEIEAAGPGRHRAPSTRPNQRVPRDPPPSDDDDAEVEIVRPGVRHEADGPRARVPVIPASDRANASAIKPAAPAKWRFFRGSS